MHKQITKFVSSALLLLFTATVSSAATMDKS